MGTPHETQLYIEIVESREELVSVWGWSDPEHAYTNITTRAGGAVFWYKINYAYYNKRRFYNWKSEQCDCVVAAPSRRPI